MFRTHDLVRLREPSALRPIAPMPAWVEPALRRAPWVVVRRQRARDGLIPVGVRGGTRAERYAAWVAAGAISERRSPEDLAGSGFGIDGERHGASPARAALLRVAPILVGRGQPWGPGGSVGFELATGVVTATATSDLDLILRQARRLERGEAGELLIALLRAAAPTRIDVLLETPQGGVSLAELVATSELLLRTTDGVRLCLDPWRLEAAGAEGERS